jgi:hypothetical protein
MGICHEWPEVRLETSRHHKFIGFQHVFLSWPIRYKYQMFDVPSSCRTRPKLFSQFPFSNLVGSEPLLDAFARNVAHRVYLGHAMVASQRIRKGTQTDITVRSKPQRDWNSFAPTVTIPRDVEETILSLTKDTRSSHKTTKTEKFILKGEMARASSSKQQIPRRRGRPRKNEEIMKAKIPEGSRVRSTAGGLLRRVTQLEPAEKLSQECGIRTRKVDVTGMNEESASQQLKQAKMDIAKLY